MRQRPVCNKSVGRWFWLAISLLLWNACGDEPTDPDPPQQMPNQRPTATFTMDATTGSAPLEITFDASASTDPDGTIESYVWSFGDGATGAGVVATHIYQESGRYTPTLTVTDDVGSSSEAAGDRVSVNSPVGSGTHAIEGVVWHDANGDGVRDASEDVIPEFSVFLDDDGDGVRDDSELRFFTDQNGRYRFEGLDGGRSYSVTQEMTVGWTNTAPGVVNSVRSLRSNSRTETDQPAFSVSAIIGGGQAAEGEFPFQVAIVTSDTRFQFCGGTFIARSWVMTAAHCVDGGLRPEDIAVLAGTNNVTSGGQLLDVTRIMIHPAFSSTAFVDHDLALLELDGEFMYPRVELLTADRVKMSDPGTLATAIGWGYTTINGSASPTLKKITAEIISNLQCETSLESDVLPVTICAGTGGSSSSVCSGDSGGPLLIPYRDRWIQVGIVSFGPFLCYQPSAFARVSALVDFVEANIPTEPSGVVVVDWNDGGVTAVVDFGNFR